MEKRKDAIIIGAGVGGLATAIYLSRQGFEVTIYEKNSFAGGRCGQMIYNGHRFDIGATLLMMPEIYKSIYNDFGKNLTEEIELIRMEPVYNIKFHNNRELYFSSDLTKMKDQLETFELGSFSRFLSFMRESYHIYELSMKNIILKNYYNAFDFFNLQNMILLARVNAFRNHYRHTCRYFRSEMLRAAFTFQNIYVGQDPFEAPAVFAILPFQEITDGVWFPKGGMYRIVENLVSIAKENGVKIEYKSLVKKIEVVNDRVQGIHLSDESFHQAGIVIANADLPYVYNELLPYRREVRRINRMQYTCSAIVFHWGMNTTFPQLEQHTVFVSENYREGIRLIFTKNNTSNDPCFYVHSPVKSDHTAAPAGQDSITAIVPVMHLDETSDTDDEKLKILVKQAILDRLRKEGLVDFQSHIKFERCYTQHTWKHVYNLRHGAVFGSLSHNIFQMGYLRPHNQHRRYRNLYFVGGGTHPGNGVPMALISAKLTSEKINKKYNEF
jgi:phytoene desaturase